MAVLVNQARHMLERYERLGPKPREFEFFASVSTSFRSLRELRLATPKADFKKSSR